MAEMSNVGKFLDFLGAAEGAGYNTIVGGGSFSAYDKHPGVVGLRTKEGPSTAAGKYQITKTTYDDIAPRLGITDFSPESQDKIALELIRRKGALADVQSGNYDAAIGKLGGTWASLPSSPYSQPKKSQEWVNAYFGGKTSAPVNPPPEFKNALYTGDTIAPQYGQDMTSMTISQAQRDAKYGGFVNQVKNIPEAIAGGFETQNYTYNYFRDKAVGEFDKDLVITKEFYQNATQGIPQDYHGYVMSGVNKNDIYARANKVKEQMETQQKLANMGVVGMGGSLTGALLDLPTLVGFIPGLGTASIVSKTNRLKNAVATGLAMGTGNVAAEAALAKYRPLATNDDLYFAGAAGLAFGLPIGFFAKAGRGAQLATEFGQEAAELSKIGQKTMAKIQIDELTEAGLEITEKGKRVLDPEYRAKAIDNTEIEAVRTESKAIPTYERSSSFTEFVPRNSGGKPYAAGSTRAELEALGKSADEFVSVPARRLLEQMADDLPFYTIPKSAKSLKGRPGQYYIDPHMVVVSKNAKDTTKVHEAAHALTVHKLDYGKANPETAHGKLYAELDGLYQQAMKEAKKAGFKSYYLQDIYEFSAGLYGGATSKGFIEFLSKVKVEEGGDTLFSKFVDTMRRLLGFDEKEMNLYLKSLGVTDQLISEKLAVNIKGKGAAADKSFLNDEYKDYMPEGKADGSPNVGYSSMGPALENFFARSWVPQEARDLFNKLAGTTAGYKNHGVVEQHAAEVADILTKAWSTRLVKSWEPTFNKYFDDLMEAGQAKRWDKDTVFTQWEEQVGNYIRGLDGDYHPSVIKTGNDARAIIRDVLDNINNPGKFNGAAKRGLTQIEEVDPETGVKTLTDPLPYNDNYLPRSIDIGKMNTFVAQFGREAADRFWANAFAKANPEASVEAAQRFGKYYVTRLQDSKLNRQNLEHMMQGIDREAFRKELVELGKMTDGEAEELLMHLLPGKKAQTNPLSKNMKNRSRVDESYTETIVMRDGTTHAVTINDFIDTRTFDVLNSYFARTGGAVSLANNLDVYKATDVERLIGNSIKQELGTALPESQRRSLEEHLQFTFDRVMSRPVEEFSVGNKLMEMWRSLHVTRLMGGAVFNQAQEMSQQIGTMGWKAVFKAIPELRALTRDVKTGKVANEMLDQLENLTGGAGADLIRRTDFSPREDWVRNRGNTDWNRWLDRADNLMSTGASAVLKYTGMTGMMVNQKRIQAIAMINHFVEAANGKDKLKFNKERLAWMGLDEADTQKVLDNIKANHKPKEGSRIGTVDFEAWQAADPNSYAKFIVAWRREANRVVQENDLASMVPIMGKGWGQTMFQFMNFPLQAWNKSMMFGMNHRDFQTMSTVLHGSLFAAVTYMARTQAQAAGMSQEEKDEFLEKRMSTKQIVANSFGRLAQVSVLPILIDSTIAPVPIFSGSRTTSNVTDFFGSNPSLSAISTTLAIPRKLALSSYSDEVQVSEKDMRNWMRLLPFNNVVGISNVLGAVAADYPNTDKQE